MTYIYCNSIIDIFFSRDPLFVSQLIQRPPPPVTKPVTKSLVQHGGFRSPRHIIPNVVNGLTDHIPAMADRPTSLSVTSTKPSTAYSPSYTPSYTPSHNTSHSTSSTFNSGEHPFVYYHGSSHYLNSIGSGYQTPPSGLIPSPAQLQPSTVPSPQPTQSPTPMPPPMPPATHPALSSQLPSTQPSGSSDSPHSGSPQPPGISHATGHVNNVSLVPSVNLTSFNSSCITTQSSTGCNCSSCGSNSCNSSSSGSSSSNNSNPLANGGGTIPYTAQRMMFAPIPIPIRNGLMPHQIPYATYMQALSALPFNMMSPGQQHASPRYNSHYNSHYNCHYNMVQSTLHNGQQNHLIHPRAGPVPYTRHKTGHVSCHNCGQYGHTANECCEKTMEALTHAGMYYTVLYYIQIQLYIYIYIS